MCEVITIDEDSEEEWSLERLQQSHRQVECLAEQELSTYPESFKRTLTQIIEPNSSKNETFHRPKKVTLPKIRKYKCEVCGSVFFCSNSLASHKRNIHEVGKIQECVLCGMVMYKAETWSFAQEDSSMIQGCPHEYWKDLDLTFDVANMMNCSIEMLTSTLAQNELPKCVVTLIKSLRRKWKNRKAAQISRNKKMRLMFRLKKDVKILQKRKLDLMEERTKLLSDLETMKKAYHEVLVLVNQRFKIFGNSRLAGELDKAFLEWKGYSGENVKSGFKGPSLDIVCNFCQAVFGDSCCKDEFLFHKDCYLP